MYTRMCVCMLFYGMVCYVIFIAVFYVIACHVMSYNII